MDLIELNDQDKSWVNNIWELIRRKTENTASRIGDKIPYTVTANGRFDDRGTTEIAWWTNGFWSALMWLMYIGTNNETYRTIAENAENRLDNAFELPEELHHDVGFMWNLSSGVNYRLTDNIKSRRRWLIASDLLAARYNIEGGFIRSWNGKGTEGYTIIDGMMNIPMLYRAAKEFGDPRYEYIAKHHADKTLTDHIRPDGSVIHIVDHDVKDGRVTRTLGGQGYGEGSSWSRGQAWGIYGFALSYIHTKDERYLNAAKRIAHYFISSVCDDYLPRCDFRSPAEPVVYDSSAGACAACGLIEIAKAVPELEKPIYLRAALNMLKAMNERFCDWNFDTDFILGFGTELYGIESKRHMPIIYGDYFFVEAIYKLKGFDFLLW